MGVIDECGMLVDELRDDPAFVVAMTRLRDALTVALTATHTRGCRERYEDVSTRLVEVIERLEAQR